MRTLAGSIADAERVDPNWADLAEMPRFYSLLEKIFVVLLLRGDVSVLLAAGEMFICGV